MNRSQYEPVTPVHVLTTEDLRAAEIEGAEQIAQSIDDDAIWEEWARADYAQGVR